MSALFSSASESDKREDSPGPGTVLDLDNLGNRQLAESGCRCELLSSASAIPPNHKKCKHSPLSAELWASEGALMRALMVRGGGEVVKMLIDVLMSTNQSADWP